MVVRPRLTVSSAAWISCSVCGVQRRGRLVEDQDRRRLEDGAGDRHALLFAARQFQPALADHGAVAVGQLGDERADLRQIGGARHLFGLGVGAAVADVVGDGVVEQHRVLRHHADRGAQAFLRHVADVLPVDQDRAALDVVEAEQQPRDRRLAGARRADDGDGLAGRHLEADALQDLPLRIVGEMHVAELDLALADDERLGARPVERPPACTSSRSNICSMSVRPWRISR